MDANRAYYERRRQEELEHAERASDKQEREDHLRWADLYTHRLEGDTPPLYNVPPVTF